MEKDKRSRYRINIIEKDLVEKMECVNLGRKYRRRRFFIFTLPTKKN
jgi:hypothetical protein